MSKINEIFDYLTSNGFCVKELILNDNEINRIYDLFFNGIFSEPISENSIFIYGKYFQIQLNYENMKKYYLRTTSLRDFTSFSNTSIAHIKI